MVFVLYGFVLVGLVLLALDLEGRFEASAERVRWWRGIGVVAGAGAGLAPLIAWLTGRLAFEGLTFPVIALGYLTGYLLFAAGVAGWLGAQSVRARRAGYALMLALVALPSWVLIFLSPFVAIGGLGLVQPRRAVEERGVAAGRS